MFNLVMWILHADQQKDVCFESDFGVSSASYIAMLLTFLAHEILQK